MSDPIHPSTHASRKRSGSALIVVLWVIGLLSMFILSFAFDMHIEARIASSWRKKIKAECLAKAGIELARFTLMETLDSDVNNADRSLYMAKGDDEAMRNAAISLAHGGGATLTRALGEGTITLNIRPENAKINVNSMILVNDRNETERLWEPLFKQAGVPIEYRDTLIDCLIDWVDADDLSQLNGVESSYYESLSPPYKAKNGPLDTVEELMLVKGFNEPISDSGHTVYQSIAPLLSTYADSDKLNINAASMETLMAFLDADPETAGTIVAERNGPDGLPGTEDDEPFKDINDLLARIPALDRSLGDHFAFMATGRYRLHSVGTVGDMKQSIQCVVMLADKKLTVMNWNEDNIEP